MVAKQSASELYIGLMSGTSMDAVDAVLVDFSTKIPKILAHHSQSIHPDLRQDLLSICFPGQDEINRLGRLDVQMGKLFANTSLDLLAKNKITSEQIRAIGSHGQTIRHCPDGQHPFTLQIGDPNIIAETTQITTVADFRRRDMAKKGQGAPLTPAFHHYVFRDVTQDRVILNIGGIANVTFLSADTTTPIHGFDTGPGNLLMDAWAQRHLKKSYDVDGAWASKGTINPPLLKSLLADAYFQQAAPKSTGREYFNLDWLDQHLIKLDSTLNPADVQATLLEVTARSIELAIKFHVRKNVLILVCGGGARNARLMQRLRELCQPHEIQSTLVMGIDPQWVEAIAFAWLAQQTLLHRAGNIPDVTGANGFAILGGIYPGRLLP